ncbi:MAG: helix-turn-helix domain-containing protein [Chloroflexi bacterium]|nr:helix-turn-helix domain-containing protein [Chloroflexota bacterium]
MIGDKIKQARTEAKLTRERFAEMVGVSSQQVFEWERNKNSPKLERIEAIARAAGKPASWFFGGKPPDMPLTRADLDEIKELLLEIKDIVAPKTT